MLRPSGPSNTVLIPEGEAESQRLGAGLKLNNLGPELKPEFRDFDSEDGQSI